LVTILKIRGNIKKQIPAKGLYEVMEYESALEILCEQGKKARFSKLKKVKYLQDSVITYPVFAWGDGEI
jgi:hypothetical protein